MILLIDNYDSFVFNVEQYIRELTSEEVKVVRNDKITINEIISINPSKIILSPGPKHPKDSGVCLEILNHLTNFPILGICLGHQAFGLVYGATIKQLDTPVHGKTSNITVKNNSILFNELPKNFKVMRYHSLYIDKNSLPSSLEILAETSDEIIMAIKHNKYNIFGVQFHPESYFTEYGKKIIDNFINYNFNN